MGGYASDYQRRNGLTRTRTRSLAQSYPNGNGGEGLDYIKLEDLTVAQFRGLVDNLVSVYESSGAKEAIAAEGSGIHRGNVLKLNLNNAKDAVSAADPSTPLTEADNADLTRFGQYVDDMRDVVVTKGNAAPADVTQEALVPQSGVSIAGFGTPTTLLIGAGVLIGAAQLGLLGAAYKPTALLT